MAATPPRTSGMCWQVDLAMHHCLTPARAAPNPCDMKDRGFAGLYRLAPALFQHTGLVNGYGVTTALRINDAWDPTGATMHAIDAAVGAARAGVGG